MPPPLTHDQCRARMCCCCGLKLKKGKIVSVKLEQMVREWGPNPGYDSPIPSYPKVICPTCERALCKVKNGKQETSWGGLHPPSWGIFHAKKIHGVRTCGSVTEPDSEPLLCDICVHVRSNPVGQKGSKSDIPKFVARGELSLPQLDTTSSLGWCQQCCQQTGPSISHPCNPASRNGIL